MHNQALFALAHPVFDPERQIVPGHSAAGGGCSLFQNCPVFAVFPYPLTHWDRWDYLVIAHYRVISMFSMRVNRERSRHVSHSLVTSQ